MQEQVIESQGIKKSRGRPRGKQPTGKTTRRDISAHAKVMARSEVIRAVRQEDIRERIAGGNIITRLEKIQSELLAIHTVDLEPVQVQRLGKAAEISLALLRKILPDLSATTITRRTEEAVTLQQVPEQQRAAINDAISAALGIAESGGVPLREDIRTQDNMTPRPRHEFLENEISDGEYSEDSSSE